MVAATFACAAVAAFVTTWVVWQSHVLARPHSSGVLRGLVVLSFACAGAFTWWRRPTSRFGPLVLGLGSVYALGALNASSTPSVYTIGRVVLAAFVVFFLYVALSFPYGAVEDRVARRAFAAIAMTLTLLWIALLALASDLPRGYMLTDCSGTCPHNPFSVAHDASLTTGLGDATRIGTLVAAIAVALLMIRESRRRTQTMRRGYAAVFVSLLCVIGAFVTYVAWQPTHGTGPRALQVVAAAAALSIPVAIVVGQLRAHVIAAWSLRCLLRDTIGGGFGLGEFQGRLREALGDRTLTLELWDPATGGYHSLDDAAERVGARRVSRPLAFDGVPLGTISYDAQLDDVSGLAQAFGVASLLCYSHRTLREQLHETQHVAQTAVSERVQLERDLHDGAVQRVASLQFGLARVRAQARSEQLGAQLARLEQHARLLRDDLRRLSHGIYPPVLVERGVVDALEEATLAISERVEISGTIPRLARHIEHALYFSALEAVQNAIHHGGGWTTARIELATSDGTVVCRVSDDGVGFDPEAEPDSRHLGLISMRERITAAGGTLAIHSRPGGGTTVTMVLPISADST